MFFRFIFLAFFLSGTAYAEEVLPPACKPFVIQSESIALPAAKPRVVLFHNVSDVDIWIAGGGFSSRIEPNLWTALALDTTALELNCIESKPGHEQFVACARVIGACEWPITARPENVKPMTFAGENMPLQALSAYIARRGFVFPDEKT